MLNRFPTVLLAILVCLPAAGQQTGGPTDSLAWFKDSFLDIREDLSEASQAGRNLMLYFHQDGCPYCEKLLRDNFGQAEIARRTQQGFDVIEINIWGDREVVGFDGVATTEKAFARNLRVMYTPTLLLLAGDGQVALRINGYYPPHRFSAALAYVDEAKYTELPFRDYLQQIDPPPASGRLHDQTHFLQRPLRLVAADPGDEPLLVLFEQKQCRGCDELHGDILRRPESRELLDRFRVAVVDMWSEETLTTPSGELLSAADWAARIDVRYAPSMVFFDAEGLELFRSEAYLRAFHVQSVLDYISSGAYRDQPELQRYIQARADALREAGVEVDIWN